MENKNIVPCKAVTELCLSKTQNFYNVIEDNMI